MNWKKRKRLTRLIHKYGLKFHREYNEIVKEWCIVSAYYGKTRFQLLNEWKDLPRDEWEEKIMVAFRKSGVYLAYGHLYDEPDMETIWPATPLEEIESDLRKEYDDAHDKQIEDDMRKEFEESIRAAIEKRINDPTSDMVPSYCVMPPDPFATALMYDMHNELTKGGS